MEDRISNTKYLALLWIVNLVVALAFTVSYLWFTADIVLEGAGASGQAILTNEGGARQALYRYAGMALAVLVLQGLLFILNSGVVPFLEPESENITPTCIKMALGSTLLVMALTTGALVVGWPRYR